jgi:hypothetical protein
MQNTLVPTAAASPIAAPHACLSTPELTDAITTLAGNLAAATYRLLALIAEFDRRQGWSGFNSCAHWLNYRCGCAMGAAREKVRVAHALEDLPRISAAFAAGRVSYSKVRAMTRVATPANEHALMNIAEHGSAAHVERATRAYRRVLRAQDREAADAVYHEREVRWRYEDDGTMVLTARLPPELGRLLCKALDAAAEEAREAEVPPDVPAETSRHACPYAQRRADALVHLAEQYLAHGPGPLKQADRHQVVVHVDRDALREDGEPGRCEFDDGPALPLETARRLACDASLVEIEEAADGTLLDVGRKTRKVPPALRRALQARDRGCRFPGCTHTRYVDAHHVLHWADGGETRLDNLLLLCRKHHHALHEGGYSIVRRDDGQWLFLTDRGEALPEDPVALY